jgi:ribokinase
MILVAGSANLDFVVRAPHIPAPGETVMGRDFKTFPGGKGANQAFACARAGAESTRMLLALGNDAHAAPLEASLNSAGVQLHVVHAPDQATGTAFICVSDDAENAITVAPGANLALKPAHLPALAGISHLLMQLEIPLPTVIAYAQAAKKAKVQVALNAAPAQALPPELLSCLNILIVNEGELAVVSCHTGMIASCAARLDVPCLVITLGHQGCCARLNGEWFFQPAFAVKPIDTTGAGDTFCGVLVAALGQGEDLQEALKFASAAGALACTLLGAQSSIPTQTDVSLFLTQQAPSTQEQVQHLKHYCGFEE